MSDKFNEIKESIRAEILLQRRRDHEYEKDLKRLGVEKMPHLKLVESIDIAEPELTEKERLLAAHCVGIHDERVTLGNWKTEGYAVYRQAKGQYYFVSWHGGRDPGVTSYQEVKTWLKANMAYHG